MLRKLLFSLLVLVISSTVVFAQDEDDSDVLGKGDSPVVVFKVGVPFDLRSEGRVVADEIAKFGNLVNAQDNLFDPLSFFDRAVKFLGSNTQANDPKLDVIQLFPNVTRPFVQFTQSETTVAVHGANEVVTYNTSNNEPIVQVGTSLFFTQLFLSGYSVSHDSGKTWTSGFMLPLPGSIVTLGDGVVVADRSGNFFFSGLGEDANFRLTIQVNKSTDGGRTFGPAVQVAQDNGGDKEWIAVGPGPRTDNASDTDSDDDRPENVYVTWTSFQSTGAQLRMGISTDGGATFTSKTVFAPVRDPNPANPQNSLSFTNPIVDQKTGFLYIPFLQQSNSDPDFIRLLVSRDAGQTFEFLSFNIPGAPDSTLLPTVAAGDLIDCGNGGGFRVVLHSGKNIGPARFGLDRFINASRLITQPAFAADGGRLFLAWSTSDSPFFGDPTSHSNIMFIHSEDGGLSWSTPVQVNPTNANDVQHIHPALTRSADGEVHVTYYTQHVDENIDVDLANSSEHGRVFRDTGIARLTSTSFPLAPTNIPFPLVGRPFNTTNYDRGIVACYSLGEYQGVTSQGQNVFASWGDERNKVTEPNDLLNPISGQTHAQQDVFTQKVHVGGNN